MKTLVSVVVSFFALVLLVAGLASIKVAQFKAMADAGKMTPPPTIVTAASVKLEHWEPTIDTVGSLAAFQGTTVTTESSGIISEIAFEAGTTVKAGDLLLKMDTSVLEAQLAASEARADLARVSADRSRELFARNSTSQAELDSAEAQLKQAKAELASIKAQIAQKQVRAPFGGRLGIRQINVGQYIDRGNAIVSLQALDPIYVNFTLPQQQLSKIKVGQKVRLVVDAMPGKTFEGKLSAINPEIESATRNVRIQATFDNPDEQLRPGMFTRVSVVMPEIKDVYVIPQTAVVYAPYGDSVFIIEKKDGQLVLRQAFVKLGETRGDFITVVSGLKEGDQVVSTGVFKQRNGAPVTIDNTLSPAFSETPNPSNS